MCQTGRDRQNWECSGGPCHVSDLWRGPGRPVPAEPSRHRPGGADVDGDRDNTLRNVLRPWTVLRVSRERNTFEDHPEGLSLEWLIKKLS